MPVRGWLVLELHGGPGAVQGFQHLLRNRNRVSKDLARITEEDPEFPGTGGGPALRKFNVLHNVIHSGQQIEATQMSLSGVND